MHEHAARQRHEHDRGSSGKSVCGLWNANHTAMPGALYSNTPRTACR
jgi:hypothetical protein